MKRAPVEKVCGNCRWHFDAFGSMQDEGGNCLALPYPDCTVVFSMPTAKCNVPHLFQPKENLGGGSPSAPVAS
jgi:hypothetical protein